MKISPVTVILLLAITVITLYYCSNFREGGDDQPPEFRAKRELSTIIDAIDLWAIDESKASSALTNPLQSYATLSKYGGLADNPDWRSSKRLIDPWGNDFIIKITTEQAANAARQTTEVRIWSCGPNMRDDGGTGDDIVRLRTY